MDEQSNSQPAPQPAIQSVPPAQPIAQKPTQQSGESETAKTVITILLLFFVYPVGVIVMWFWTKWKLWLKILITSLLLLIGVLGILSAVVLIAINPSAQFAKANDTKRMSDADAIVNAVSQYMAVHQGSVPAGITEQQQTIAKNGADICKDLVPDYMMGLPVDPKSIADVEIITDCSGQYNTEYQISINTATKQITVSAPLAQGSVPISVTR